jgi:hypothetical protein
MTAFYVARIETGSTYFEKILYRSNSFDLCEAFINSLADDSDVYIFNKAGDILS